MTAELGWGWKCLRDDDGARFNERSRVRFRCWIERSLFGMM